MQGQIIPKVGEAQLLSLPAKHYHNKTHFTIKCHKILLMVEEL